MVGKSHGYGSGRSATLMLLAAVVPVLANADSGDFYSEVQRLKGLAFPADSNLYVPPTSQQITDFQTLVKTLVSGNISTATTEANALDYDLVNYSDTTTGRNYYELREQLVGGQQQTGWGTYVYNPSGSVNAIVEVPHILFDENSENLGARIFQDSNARFFIMAGAQRNANGTGTADVAHLSSSIFLGVHEAWAGASGQTTAYQIHGFDEGSLNFPADASAVMADGSGSVTARMQMVDTKLAAQGLYGYAYNTLPASALANVAINTSSTSMVYSGSTFSALGATTNVESAYSRSIGGTFVHIETAQSVRLDSTTRDQAATAIAQAMMASNVTLKYWDGGAGTSATGSWTANSSAGQNWSSDGIPDATTPIFFDDSLVATLPSSMNLIRTTAVTAVPYLVWNANDSSELHAATTSGSNSILAFNGDGVNDTTPLISMSALAVNNTLTFKNTNTAASTAGKVVLQMNTSGSFNVQNAGATLQIDALLTQSGGPKTLEKTGDGLLILTNSNNDFTGNAIDGWGGGVIISGGNLSISSFNQIGQTPSVLVPGSVTLNGGTLLWTGTSSSTSVTVNRGLTVNSPGGTINETSAAAVISWNGQITGSGTLTKSGPGELRILTATNTSSFTGGYAVVGGMLTFDSVNRLSATPTAAAVQLTIDNGGTMKFNISGNANLSANRQGSLGTSGGTLEVTNGSTNLTFAGNINGGNSAGLIKTGAGLLALTGSNTFGAGVTVAAGTLAIDTGTSLGSAPSTPQTNLTLNGTTLRWIGTGATSSLSGNRNVMLNSTGGTIDMPTPVSMEIAGVIGGSGALTKTGVGQLVLSGNNTFTGGVVVTGGSVSISQGANLGALPATSATNLTLDGGTLQAAAGFTLGATRNIQLNPGGGTFDVESANPFTVAGQISGSGSLTKIGVGTLVLSPGNNYSGATTLAAGTLSVSAASALGFTPGTAPAVTMTILNNANLQSTGSYTTGRAIAIGAGGATLEVSGAATTVTRTAGITGTDTLTKTGAGELITPAGTLPPLNVSDGTLSLPTGVSNTNGLAIGATGVLDINSGAMIVNYTGASPAANIRTWIASASNGGAWNGTSGITSSSAAADTNFRTAVAYAEASNLGLANGGSFGGTTIPGQAVVMKYTYNGDNDLDGKVTLNDFSIFVDGFNGLGNGWVYGDYDYSGTTDLADFSLFVDAYKNQGAALSTLESVILNDPELSTAQKNAMLSAVPEPGTMSLLGAGAARLVMRRRRRFA